MKMPPTQVEFVAFEGGLDQITPPLMMPAGRCRDAQNYEINTLGGYSTTLGYERFDGRTSPSDALAYLMSATVTGSVALGNTITGATSGATGVVIAFAADRLVFTKRTGTFTASEVINIGGSPVATATALAVAEGGDTAQQRAQYKNLAADLYRADIQVVPGDGQVRGVKFFEGTLYAWRNNVGNTACAMYKSTAGGWSAVDLGEQIDFTNGNASLLEGYTLTKGSVTATIKRVVVLTGSLASGTNTGYLVISARAGGNYTAGAATTASGGTLTLSGVQTAITLLPNGRFTFAPYNFGSGLRLYGCDGVNRAFEFDGTTFVPIRTGMTVDAPTLLAAHKNHLFLSFNNSLQHSAIGNPYSYSPVLGAAELNLGDTITNLLPMPSDNVAGGAMACFTRQRSFMLYGNSSADWQLLTQRYDTGALAYTAQFVNTAYVMDNRGVTSMDATSNFGNFEASSISSLIRPWLMENKTRALDSCVVRDKNQLRLLFGGGRVLTMTLVDNKPAGFMPLLLAHQMVLLEGADDTLGREVIFYGGADGYTYQAERGTSFDGQPIESYLTLAFNHAKSPRLVKQYRKVVFEIGGAGFATFYYAADLGYGATEISQYTPTEVTTGEDSLGVGTWDSSTWDSATWDGSSLLPAEQAVSGVAQNMSMRVTQGSDYFAPLTFYGALIHFTPRRQLR